MKHIIYSVNRNNKLWPSIAEKLSNDHGWEPEYWVAPPSQKALIEEKFPDSIFHLVYDAHRSIPPGGFEKYINRPVDANTYDTYRKYRSNALDMMDRMDMDGSFTYHERVRNYNRILRYWLAVIDDTELDLAIFSDAPHNVGQYLLYAICIENDIQTVLFTSASVPRYVFARAEVDTMPDILRETYQTYISDGVSPDISAKSEEYLDEITRTDIQKNSSTEESRFSDIRRMLYKIADIRKYPKYFRYLLTSKTIHRKPSGGLPENTAVLGYQDLVYKKKSNLAQRRLRKHYDSVSQEPDYDQQYIYFPLHLQPERATNPVGGVYSNQYLVANLLSEHIPDDWRIYIKEHPLQFSSSNLGEQGRSTYNHDDFSGLDNVELIDMDASQTKLIDSATAVATVTGTAGWEAVNRGIPAIVFGNASYQFCTGVYHVKTESELESALRAVRDGVEIDPVDVRRFVQAIETIGYRVPMHDSESIESTRAEAVDRYVSCITEFVENTPKKSVSTGSL
jgi:hypothetical protein